MAGIRAQRKAERPGQILEAAFEEFVVKGYAATRLEDVAVRAGVTKGTIYVYYESKEQVFESVVTELSVEPIHEFQKSEAAWTDDFAADIDGFLRRLYRFCAENERSREILRLLIAEANRFPALVDRHFEVFMSPVLERLRDRFTRAIAAGEIREMETCELAEVALGPILSLNVMMLLFANRRPLDTERFMANHRRLLLGGLIDRSGDGVASVAALSNPGRWSPWRAFPDPRLSGSLEAPIGPGAFELRLRDGEMLLFGAARSVVGRLATLIPTEIAPQKRKSASRRRFLAGHLDELEYRVCASANYEAALEVSHSIRPEDYRFGRLV